MKKLVSLLMALMMIVSCTAAFADEAKVIKQLTYNQSYDMNEDYVAKLLEEATGYKVEYHYWTDEQQLALEVSSNTDYDIISVSTGMFQTLRSQGALKNIAPLLEQYPEMKEAIAAVGWQYVSGDDGGIYGIPRITDPVYNTSIGYRTDIFAQYGYEEPNTIEELRTLLEKIKADTGLIPLTGKSPFIPVIASAYGLTNEYELDEETGKLVSYLRMPGMKDYLAWMRDAYAAGLIDPDLPINSTSSVKEKMCAGNAVMTQVGHSNTLDYVNALVAAGYTDAYFKCIIPLEDANGTRHIGCSNGVSRVDIIPVTASDEEALYTLGMVASRLTEENYWLFNDGIEGTHYYFDEEGYPIPNLPIFNDDMGHGDVFQIGRNQYVHPISWMARVHKSQVQWDTFYDSNSKAAAYPFKGNPLTYISSDVYTEYSTALKTLCEDFFLQVICGTRSLDEYDAFVAEWEAAGGLEIEAAINEWYQANPDLVAAGYKSISPYAEIFGYTFE